MGENKRRKDWNKRRIRPRPKDDRDTGPDLWESILVEPTFDSPEGRGLRRRDPGMQFFGWSAVEEVIPKLLAILRPDAVGQTEEDFCRTSHCPPEKLKEWLAAEWTQHHATEVARLAPNRQAVSAAAGARKVALLPA